MTTYDTLKQTELTEAVENFKRAFSAIQSGHVSVDVISKKGQTLMSVNRTRQHTVKMTVGY